MNIKDITANQGNIDIVCDVVRKDSIREFEKFGKVGKVCNAMLADVTGEIMFSLWNDDIEKINVGDKVQISGGWCSEFKGVKQLSAGKYGKFEVVGKGVVVPSSVASSSGAQTVSGTVGNAAVASLSSGSHYNGDRGYSNSKFKYAIDEDIELLTPPNKPKVAVDIPKKKVYDPYDDDSGRVYGDEPEDESDTPAHESDEEYVE